MTMCGSGCTLRGEHLTDCDGTTTDRHGREVECAGCLPRPAEYGRLCGRCWGRLQSLVRTMPSLAEHLEAMGEPSLSSPMGHTGAGHGRPGELSLYPAALGVLDDLHALLASWCTEVATERGLGLPVAGTRWTAMDSDGGREPIGPARPGATRELVAWLDPHLPWCASQPWADAMLEDLATATSRALRSFPMEQVERRTSVACPGCGCPSLLVSPPPAAGADETVRCRVCGLVLSESEWAVTRQRALVLARAEAEAVEGA